MTENSVKFQELLKKDNMQIEFSDDKDGNSFCNFYQKLKCGANVRILVIFDSEENLVSVYGLDYINIPRAMDRKHIYELLNELNLKYTYFKFATSEDSIMISNFTLVDGEFKPETIMKIILGMINIMETEYDGLMKILWK